MEQIKSCSILQTYSTGSVVIVKQNLIARVRNFASRVASRVAEKLRCFAQVCNMNET